MPQSIILPEFQQRTAEYFAEKIRQAKGTDKMLFALEMSNYIRDAHRQGLTFEELEKDGFKFAKVPDIKN
jgi:hypothetical protein